MALRHRILPVAAAVGVVVLTLMPAARSAAAPIHHQWTLDSLTNPPGGTNGDLPGVACPSVPGSTTGPAFCIAVGGFYDIATNTNKTLAEIRSASGVWSIQPTPNPSSQDGLSDVACPSVTLCIAVGRYEIGFTDTRPLAEVWNGATWSQMTIPNPADGGQLQGISCPSTTACTAVGHHFRNNAPLAERWNGSTWTIQTTPVPPDGASFGRVSCPTTTWCMAVGGEGGSPAVPFAEVWSGGSWTQHSPPPPQNEPFSGLTNVSCWAPTGCMTVGDGFTTGKVLAYRWTGLSWILQNTLDAGPQDQLVGVSCPTSTACIAVGDYGGVSAVAFAEVWDGTTWSIQSMPAPDGWAYPQSVVCWSTTGCESVGEYILHSPSNSVPLAYRYG
jgi:hypothetical protein